MSGRRSPWLPWVLFRLTVGVALLLFGLVVLAPWLDAGAAHPQGWQRLIAVFARDLTLRRTALASGVGLLVTASVFFRTPVSSTSERLPKSPKRPSSRVGA
jgi:hypothetical protein